MPVISGLTDPLLVKYFHQGRSDRWVAENFGISVQAVVARRNKLNLFRKPISRQVNESLAVRWKIKAAKEGSAHHNAHAAKSLKIYLRMRLGDASLSEEQKYMAGRWVDRLRERDVVLCYDPERSEGWHYRPRQPEDERRVVDWPADIPFPSEGFKRALDLPLE